MTCTKGFCSPTTDIEHKVNELRIPSELILHGFKTKRLREVEALTLLKLLGSRIGAKSFFKFMGVHPKTGKRLITRLEKLKWVGFDGRYIFPRSWSRIHYRKTKGLYLGGIPRGLKSVLFTHALKEITRRAGANRARQIGCAMPKEILLPVRYYTTSLNISERSYFRHLKDAIRLRLLQSIQSWTKVGLKKEFDALRQNLHGVPLFVKGKFVVSPQPSKLKFLI